MDSSSPSNCPTETFLSNFNNSCYLHSLLFALFNNKNPFIEKELLKADLIDYARNNVFLGFQNNIKTKLNLIYENIHSENAKKHCANLRIDFQNFYKNYIKIIEKKEISKEDEKKFIENVGEPVDILNLFTQIFNIPTTLKKNTDYGSEELKFYNIIYEDVKNYTKSTIFYNTIQQNLTIRENIFPNPNIEELQFKNNIFKLKLNSFIIHINNPRHYVTIYKCGNSWYLFNDLDTLKKIKIIDINNIYNGINDFFKTAPTCTITGLFYIPEYNEKNLDWFKEILTSFENEVNDYYKKDKKDKKDKNYLNLNYDTTTTTNTIIINDYYNIIEILKDIINDDDVSNRLIFEKYNNRVLFLPLFIKKILDKDSTIIDCDINTNNYYFNIPYNNELNLNNYYEFLLNKLIKLYKTNYLIINKYNSPNIYNNKLNLIGTNNNNISSLFIDFFQSTEDKLIFNSTKFVFSTYSLPPYTLEKGNIEITNYEKTDSNNDKNFTELLKAFKAKYLNFIKEIDFSDYNSARTVREDDKELINYKKEIINQLFDDKIKNELLEIYPLNKNEISILSNNRLLEIYSNTINANERGEITIIDDDEEGNNCIPSFLFAILNRKNKYIEKYFLNANINSKINNYKIIILAKQIQQEFKFIYNILTDKEYRVKNNIIESYKIGKLNKYFQELSELSEISVIEYRYYKTDMKELINLLYYLYDIKDINYDINKKNIKIFNLETNDFINISKAKILLYKIITPKIPNTNNYIIKEYYNESKKFPVNNIYNLYINTIIFYINGIYYTIYNKNNSYFYKDKDIETKIEIERNNEPNYGNYIQINELKTKFSIDTMVDLNSMETYVYYSYL